ncbi:MAG: sugar phosphate isomerase/epimerase [Ruminococcaceae bacterium]|nr:sugar phosphate isomerase/epimerase [Oscillospiraceae bacterium]
MILGAQLYTLRTKLTTLEGLDAMLKAVADIGYKAVQLSGISCEYTPEWITEKCREYGLEIALTHVDFETLVKDIDKVIANHKIMDCKYVGLGCFPNFRELTEESMNGYLEALMPSLKKLKDNGMKFMYHNHDVEYGRPGKDRPIFFDLILDAAPADLFGITLDMYWVQAGGADCAEWLYKLADRAHCIHLKDMVYDMTDRKPHYAPIGYGNMNYREIVKICEEIGSDYAFVELDNTYGEDPLDCLKRSYDYLTTLGLK